MKEREWDSDTERRRQTGVKASTDNEKGRGRKGAREKRVSEVAACLAPQT